MEVHHHTKTIGSRKKWTHYFWEFLMLFLAVFCGFLAEYQLEHKIEKDRANELAKNFYQELKEDSATAELKIRNRIKQEDAITYLVKFFKDSSLNNLSKQFSINFLYGMLFRSPVLFEPRVIILEQLKNSGSLRYFKNEEFQKLVGELTVAIKNIYDRQELETQYRFEYIDPLVLNHYDYNFDETIKKGNQSIFSAIEKYESDGSFIPFQLNQESKLNRESCMNILSFYRANVIGSTRMTFIEKYRQINASLLRLLRDYYRLK